ncbi:MAG TPA: FHA domain-containing protein [Dermatophilaceae bacterium]|nr:FHA domain-containing protein [Dermatophilaceae bacterium]
MSTTTCPNGHPSASSDYCDTCGAPIGESPASDVKSASSSSPATTTSETSAPCPNCALVNTADALFCEGCGYDFTTGTMPRQSAPTNPLDLGAAPAQPAVPDSVAPAIEVEWVAEVWIDPDWYAEQHAEEPCPSPGLPVVVPLRTQSLLIGRTSRSRNIHPEIECAADIGVSRRHAQLTTDGQRWWVEDLQSSNGTYVGAASTALPTDPLPPGQRRELAQDDRIYVGAWTCIVVRRATPEEQAGQV